MVPAYRYNKNIFAYLNSNAGSETAQQEQFVGTLLMASGSINKYLDHSDYIDFSKGFADGLQSNGGVSDIDLSRIYDQGRSQVRDLVAKSTQQKSTHQDSRYGQITLQAGKGIFEFLMEKNEQYQTGLFVAVVTAPAKLK